MAIDKMLGAYCPMLQPIYPPIYQPTHSQSVLVHAVSMQTHALPFQWRQRFRASCSAQLPEAARIQRVSLSKNGTC